MLTTSTGKPTKAQEKRFVRMKYLGCVCCILRGFHEVQPEIHHLTSGGRRRGHDLTVALCPWHHRGALEGRERELLEDKLGPNLKYNRRQFIAEFGTDDELLEAQNRMLEAAHGST